MFKQEPTGLLSTEFSSIQKKFNNSRSMTVSHGRWPLKIAGRQVDPLLFSEIKSFLSHVPTRYQNYFTVAFFTGLRTSELIGLKSRHLDFDRRVINVWDSKSGQRMVYMSSLVEHALRNELAQSKVDSEFVFHNAKGRSLNDRTVARKIWYPTLEKAGIRKRLPQQIRHTTATIWLIAGENPMWVSQQMGYRNKELLASSFSSYLSALVHKGGSATEQLLLMLFRKQL